MTHPLAWTPALMLHLTNPCAKLKVLSLTKPKCKIYKTKSLGNYITLISSLNVAELVAFVSPLWQHFKYFKIIYAASKILNIATQLVLQVPDEEKTIYG